MIFYGNDSTHHQAAIVRLTTAQIIATFYDEARVIVPTLIAELQALRDDLVQSIGDRIVLINAESQDKSYRYFWKLWLMLNEGEKLQAVDNKLARLHRLQNIIDDKPMPKGALPHGAIEAAREAPIATIVGEQLRRIGKDYLCVCPMHEDHDPSMRVYVDQNRAWCYVCNDGGDTIKLYMLINGCDFKTAVTEMVGSKA